VATGKTRATIGLQEFKGSMKRATTLNIFLSCIVILFGCTQQRSEKVLVIEKTKSYHTDRCSRIIMASTKMMTKGEAEAMNYSPCPGCQPDKEE